MIVLFFFALQVLVPGVRRRRRRLTALWAGLGGGCSLARCGGLVCVHYCRASDRACIPSARISNSLPDDVPIIRENIGVTLKLFQRFCRN